jgi:hypothetical protein
MWRLKQMGKTDEPFRMALEREINGWNGFTRALRKPDRITFDELMDACRSYSSENSNVTNPVVFEPMIMRILLVQQLRIQQIECKLKDLLLQTQNERLIREVGRKMEI